MKIPLKNPAAFKAVLELLERHDLRNGVYVDDLDFHSSSEGVSWVHAKLKRGDPEILGDYKIADIRFVQITTQSRVFYLDTIARVGEGKLADILLLHEFLDDLRTLAEHWEKGA